MPVPFFTTGLPQYANTRELHQPNLQRSEGKSRWWGHGELNLAHAAAFCEEKFGEWDHQAAIIKRFRSLMWEAAVIRVFRRAALEVDEKERVKRLGYGDSSIIKGPLTPSPAEAVGTPAYLVKRYLAMTDVHRRRAAFVTQPSFEGRECGYRVFLTEVLRTRQHMSTDNLLEYRVEVCPPQLVELARSDIKGTRPLPAGTFTAFNDVVIEGSSRATKKTPKGLPPDPHSNMRVWIPVSIV